jgi:integrase
MRQKITKSVVDAMPPGSLIWDTEVPRLGIRRRADAKVYVVKYRTADRRQRWARIGAHGSPWTPETARREALRLLGDVAGGADPVATKIGTRTAPTVSDLCERFLSEHVAVKLKATTATEYRRLVATIVTPKLGPRLITAVTRDDVARLHHLLRGAPYNANRVLALLGKLFALAERWGLRPDGTNPARRLERYRERSRERYLSGDELARLGATLDDAEREKCPQHPAVRVESCNVCMVAGRVSPFIVAAVRMLVYTGMRRSEVLGLRWEDIDEARGVIRLAEHKTDRGGAKSVPLTPAVADLLGRLPRLADTPYIFAGRREGEGLRSIKKAWARIRKAAGLADVRLHDLRHSYASVGIDAGLNLPAVGALLGHTSPVTTKRYAHVRDAVKAEAAELVGARIAAAMGNGKAEVAAKAHATMRVHLLVEGNKPACGRAMKRDDDVSYYLARVTCAGCRRKGTPTINGGAA